MTRSYLRLSPSGRWLPSSRSFNLSQRHPPLPASPRRSVPPAQQRLDALKTEPLPTPLVRAPPSVEEEGGTTESNQDGEEVAVVAQGGAAKEGPTRFLGVDLPVKPSPPAEGECCMSGCAHCVYDLYLEDLESYHSLLSTARSAVLSRLKELKEGGQLIPAEGTWPEELGKPVQEGKEGEGEGGKGAEEKAKEELDRVRKDLDPTMRAFLEMEARMKEKEKARQQPSPTG